MEIRDPAYGFIELNAAERRVLDSWPVQRLRDIRQLGLTCFVYPGGTHSRLEHSLGVMDLASRVYDIITNPANIVPRASVAKVIPDGFDWQYWRRVVRLAALCHDIGHPPFSHSGEGLFVESLDHEKMTLEAILSDTMRAVWTQAKVDGGHVARVAVGAKYFPEKPFDDLQAILSEVITADVLGADRMDYLLRDSYHAGVAYGRFDVQRLVQNLRILPRSEEEPEPVLGIHEDGLHCAESLLLARYMMYMQVYFHDVRRAYDWHLTQFLKNWLPDKRFPTNLTDYLSLTDSTVLAAMQAASRVQELPGHEHARRILERQHYRLLYKRKLADRTSLDYRAAQAVSDSAKSKYGEAAVTYDCASKGSGDLSFPVLASDQRVFPSTSMSELVGSLPQPATEYVFVAPELRDEAADWLEANVAGIVQPAKGGLGFGGEIRA